MPGTEPEIIKESANMGTETPSSVCIPVIGASDCTQLPGNDGAKPEAPFNISAIKRTKTRLLCYSRCLDIAYAFLFALPTSIEKRQLATFIPDALQQADYSVSSMPSRKDAGLTDGVLHPYTTRGISGHEELLPQCVELVKSVVGITRAKIILSSTWQLKQSAAQKSQEIGLHIYGMTSDWGGGAKSHADEILEWVGKYHVKGWVAFDDEDLRRYGRCWTDNPMEGHFVQTDLEDQGMSESDASNVIHLLCGSCAV